MLTLVINWYPIFLYLVLIEGKFASGKIPTTTGELVDHCDVECSKQIKNAGSCTVRRLSKDTGDSITNSSLKVKAFEVPNPPYKVSMASPDETKALEVNIDSGTVAFVASQYYLVKLEVYVETETNGRSQYLLLDVRNNSRQALESLPVFSFKCAQIDPEVFDIRLYVWTLGPNLAKRKNKKFLFKMYKDYLDRPSSARINILTQRARYIRRTMNDCACNSKVTNLRLTNEGTSAKGFVQVTNLPEEAWWEVLLMYDNKTRIKEVRRWSGKGKGNHTEVGFTHEHLKQGTYYIKVKRYCPTYKIRTTCGAKNPPDIVSKDMEVKSEFRADEGVYKSQTSNVASQVSMVKTPTIWLAVKSLIMFISFFIAMLILVAGILKWCTDKIGGRYQHHVESMDHRESAERLIPVSPSIPEELWQLREEQKTLTPRYEYQKNDVPMIYMEDNKTLKQNVYSLKNQLRACGVNAFPVDEETCPGINSNWIDFGEQLSKTYKNFVFVVSPLLYKMCHEGKYGDKNIFHKLVQSTKGQHLALVLLRNFDGLYFKYRLKPRIYLVEMIDNTADGRLWQKTQENEADECLFQKKHENEKFKGDALSELFVVLEGTDPNTQVTEESVKTENIQTTDLKEGTLSHKLVEDHYILYEAMCFSIPLTDLQSSNNFKSNTVQYLSHCLKT